MIKSWSFDTHLESLSIYRRVDTFLRSKEGLSLCFGEMFGQKFPIHYQLANRSFGFVGSRGHGASQGSAWGWIALVGRHGGLKSVSEDDCGMGGKRSFLWRIFMCLRRPEKSRKDFHWTKKCASHTDEALFKCARGGFIVRNFRGCAGRARPNTIDNVSHVSQLMVTCTLMQLPSCEF